MESGNKLGGSDTGLGASSMMESQHALNIYFFTCKVEPLQEQISKVFATLAIIM